MSISQLFQESDGLGLAEQVRKGAVTPGELLDEAIKRTEQWNPKIGAIVVRHEEFAREQLRKGLPDGPFHGVPFLLKDLVVQLSGTETSNGSRFFAGRIADYNSTIVDRYLASGVTIFGKTSCPELGLSGASDPVLYGPTRNPWNLDFSAGGSSGGAAAAVAAGIVPMAHASDGGGSIRVPASVCGLVGLKPSRARIPSGPLRGESWAGLSSNHVITRSVRDCAAMLDATAGPETGDPYEVSAPQRPFLAEVSSEPKQLLIGINLHRLDGTPADSEVVSALMDVAKLLEDLGHRVEFYKHLAAADEVAKHFGSILLSHVNVSLSLREEELGRAVTENDVENLTWFLYHGGKNLPATDYVKATFYFQQLGRRMGQLHEKFDLVLGPTCTIPAMPLGVVNMNGDIAAHTEALRQFVPSICVSNMTGQPSISLPLSWSKKGTPIGSMFTAPIGGESLLFQLAGQLERASPWANRRPQAPS